MQFSEDLERFIDSESEKQLSEKGGEIHHDTYNSYNCLLRHLLGRTAQSE